MVDGLLFGNHQYLRPKPKLNLRFRTHVQKEILSIPSYDSPCVASIVRFTDGAHARGGPGTSCF